MPEAKTKKIKIPKQPAACADLLYQTREERYELQKAIDAKKALEQALTEYFINTLPKSDSTGIAGKVARVQTGTKDVPQVEDWEALYKHIKKTGAFELLQRRLGEGACRDRWAAKKTVPGVGVFHAVVVSVTKIPK